MSTKNLSELWKLTPGKREEVMQSAATKGIAALAKKLLDMRKAELETIVVLAKKLLDVRKAELETIVVLEKMVRG